MKGQIQPDHISKNNYELQITGLPTITFIDVSDLPQELDVVDLPDRTQASGGTVKASEYTAMVPSHHDVEIAAMEAWFLEAKDPVSPTYKKSGVLIQKTISGEVGRTYALVGQFIAGRTIQQMQLENQGEMQVNVYTIKFDDILPTG